MRNRDTFCCPTLKVLHMIQKQYSRFNESYDSFVRNGQKLIERFIHGIVRLSQSCCMEMSSLDYLLNFFFCVPWKKQRHQCLDLK